MITLIRCLPCPLLRLCHSPQLFAADCRRLP